jgi:hypothetical protein
MKLSQSYYDQNNIAVIVTCIKNSVNTLPWRILYKDLESNNLPWFFYHKDNNGIQSFVSSNEEENETGLPGGVSVNGATWLMTTLYDINEASNINFKLGEHFKEAIDLIKVSNLEYVSIHFIGAGTFIDEHSDGKGEDDKFYTLLSPISNLDPRVILKVDNTDIQLLENKPVCFNSNLIHSVENFTESDCIVVVMRIPEENFE